jgi:hypothetical protein
MRLLRDRSWAGNPCAVALVLGLGNVFGLATNARAEDVSACINANEQAVTLQKSDKLIEARASLSMCASASCPDVIRTSCQERLSKIAQTIPSIVFAVRDSVDHDLTAVILTIDGKTYSGRLDTEILLDPGDHEFHFEAAGQEPIVKHLVLREGEHGRRENVFMEGVAPSIGPVAASAQASPPSAPVVVGAERAADHGKSQRSAGLVVGGVGAASIVTGAIFGGLSIAAHSNYEKYCGANIGAPAGQCMSPGLNGEKDAATKGNLSTAFFVVGGLALAAGAGLFFLAPASAGAQVGIGPGMFVMKGRF